MTGLIAYAIGKFVALFILPGLLLFFSECLVVLVFFLLPIYLLKIENESVDYLDKIVFQLKNRLFKK
jgi:hypothetical protein